MSPLKIYKASAGSGKTYALTLEYLRLILAAPDRHRHILAVTFTNKAAREMKQRILGRLHALSEDSPEHPAEEMQVLADTTGLGIETIRKRAGELLHGILNDFSGFSVGTIDRFFQSVIRAFTREIGVQPGYNLELDNERILSLAIERLFQGLSDDLQLQGWLIRFARERMEESRSWNFREDMIGLGMQLFRETFQQLFQDLDLSSLDKTNLDLYQRELNGMEETTLQEMARIGKRALSAMADEGWQVSDFRQKHQSPASLFATASEGSQPNFTDSRVEAIGDPSKWLTRSAPSGMDAFVDTLMMPMYRQLYRHQVVMNTIRVIRHHLYTMGILVDIWDAVSGYTREQNLFLISDSSRFLKGIIGSDQVPFIYERTGNRYHHIMLDEFQDTSVFQYDNFRPLLDNSLAAGYDNLAVGDVKQSIYRWRNSDWNILAADLERDFRHQECSIHTLGINFRSLEQIIRFNNTVFQSAAGILAERIAEDGRNSADREEAEAQVERFKKAYADVVQDIPESRLDSGGMVHVEQFEDEDERSFREQVLERLPAWIGEILDSGVDPGDIAILVRSRKEGSKITEKLLEHAGSGREPYRYRVISNESLLIGQNRTVMLLVAVLRYLVYSDDPVNNALIKQLGFESGLIAGISPDRLFDPATGVEDLLPAALVSRTGELRQMPLFELTETLIGLLDLEKQVPDLPYLQTFQNLVIDIQRREPISLTGFLEYWEQHGAGQGITLTENSDAIRILTIHKAKGLEFKAVLVPFCNWEISTDFSKPSIIWCATRDTPFNRIPTVPVRLSRTLRHTLFADSYYREQMRGYMDNLNLLYVAMTRAREILFLGVPKTDKDTLSHTGDLLQMALSRPPVKGPAIDNLDRYREGNALRIGKMPVARKKPREEDPWKFTAYRPGSGSRKIGIRMRSDEYFVDEEGIFSTEAAYGNTMHQVFSRIFTPEDVPRVLDDLQKQGLIPFGERMMLEERILGLISRPDTAEWFSGGQGRKIRTERAILCRNGVVVRPDRVIVDGRKATVVDFKFGKVVRQQHSEQVAHYLEQLKQMGYSNPAGYLWYVELDKIENVISP